MNKLLQKLCLIQSIFILLSSLTLAKLLYFRFDQVRREQFLFFCHVSVAKRQHFVSRVFHGNYFKGSCRLACSTTLDQKYNSYGQQDDHERNADQYDYHDCVWTGFSNLLYRQSIKQIKVGCFNACSVSLESSQTSTRDGKVVYIAR